MNKLHQALASAPLKEAEDTNVHNEHNEHASADEDVHTGVEYTNNVVHTDAPAKLTDMVFFGIVKGW